MKVVNFVSQQAFFEILGFSYEDCERHRDAGRICGGGGPFLVSIYYIQIQRVALKFKILEL